MRVLVACELSGTVRDAFRNLGHDAWSCDLLPCDRDNKYHLQGDILSYIDDDWDLMIAHPPCTHLAVSGARWFKEKTIEQVKNIVFVEILWEAPIEKIAIENPVGILSTESILGKPSQYIEPWQFGHCESKKTGLWLKNLPLLKPTNIVPNYGSRIHKMSETSDRAKKRSKTYFGIAEAMAKQWDKLEPIKDDLNTWIKELKNED